MCGLTGYIGESKKPVLTYQLITKLFEKSESRGLDAAGFWGTESGIDGRVLYHKEPLRASQFVKKEAWKNLASYNPNLLLAHARGASKGVGEPRFNHNNHPFTSSDKSLGLIHNGRVDECEYQAFKQKYELSSNCDSEILLRIFENKPTRLEGIQDIFSLINEGHMAVSIGERLPNGERMMWLFRNQHRPLWIIDMREALGQIFFISEPNIWEDAVNECSGVKTIAKSQKLIELPVEQIWQFKITCDEIHPKSVERYEVVKENLSNWTFDGKKYNRILNKPSFGVITNLDDNDQIISQFKIQKEYEVEENQDYISMSSINHKCDEMISIVESIRAYVDMIINEGSITDQDYDQLLQNLEDERQQLDALSRIIVI
jgi:hypothetical protein